jgi:hypothetical protein
VRRRCVKQRLISSAIPIHPIVKKIKLELPEVFVESIHGFEYVSRPEFSDSDSSLEITISSDSD